MPIFCNKKKATNLSISSPNIDHFQNLFSGTLHILCKIWLLNIPPQLNDLPRLNPAYDFATVEYATADSPNV